VPQFPAPGRDFHSPAAENCLSTVRSAARDGIRLAVRLRAARQRQGRRPGDRLFPSSSAAAPSRPSSEAYDGHGKCRKCRGQRPGPQPPERDRTLRGSERALQKANADQIPTIAASNEAGSSVALFEGILAPGARLKWSRCTNLDRHRNGGGPRLDVERRLASVVGTRNQNARNALGRERRSQTAIGDASSSV
jgi:hypothetical protein